MARIEHVTLVDDVDGGTADETVEFTADNVAYEIDLSRSNATALREALAPYISAARRTTSDQTLVRRPRSATSSMSTEQRQRNNAIRTWVRNNGYTVAERGRISVDVVTAYEQRDTTSASSPSPTGTSAPRFQEAG
ncbi:Histone protein Lsr2 [Pseudonocardia sp. Ae168_Ps1]|uniref:histone-like nucleoid-structuring protein Lsr2 n=1 Tax=unclassified Pseudonocardia TaxID=2619320 RepID=UPI00094B2851|nr:MULTISPECIES: Lsr2 family protein [unclassified Pseudonocardia]OLL70444.1 Histone protein Lsr2 [Pseudonocardia sp. Ae168_Ps1]OLL71563.1 Histone protein Lsr2 [Pseudonocardia sp. Ae263_Ps1]